MQVKRNHSGFCVIHLADGRLQLSYPDALGLVCRTVHVDVSAGGSQVARGVVALASGQRDDDVGPVFESRRRTGPLAVPAGVRGGDEVERSDLSRRNRSTFNEPSADLARVGEPASATTARICGARRARSSELVSGLHRPRRLTRKSRSNRPPWTAAHR